MESRDCLGKEEGLCLITYHEVQEFTTLTSKATQKAR